MEQEKTNKIIATKMTVALGIFILIISSMIIALYPKIDGDVNKLNVENIAKQHYTQQYFINSNYGLYYQLFNENQQDILTPIEIFLTEKDSLNEYYTPEVFNEYIQRAYTELLVADKYIDYYAYNWDIDRQISNIKGEDFAQIKEQNQKVLEELYYYYIYFNYDEDGNLSIGEISSENSNKDILSEESNLRYNFLSNNRPIQPVRNTTYFYGIKDLEYFDMGTNYIDLNYRSATQQYIIGFSIILLGVFILIPNKLLRTMKWLQKIHCIPIECTLIGTVFYSIMHINLLPYMIQEYMEKRFTLVLGFYIPVAIENDALGIGINILTWGLYILSILIAVSLIKHIYNIGVRDYIRKYSLSYRLVKLMNKVIEKFIKKLSHIDFQEKSIRGILRFIIINAFIISGFCLLSIWGIIGVVVYSIILYFLAAHVLKNIKSYYDKLLQTTSSLAKGELHIETIEEDLGMFEPIKKHIEVIQEDFKKSIEEEVRAQKFKTDLITNVSHDLKTPLTSIISYIDLMKQEGLKEEKQKEYIDVLDRKSARLQTLIEDLFEMSKASSGSIQLYEEQVDVVDLIKQTMFELEDKIQASNIIFRTQFPEHKVYLSLDSMRSFRVFDNLINNITKYAMPNSRAYIKVEEKESEVIITLKNTAREELTFDTDYITERFVRGDESRGTEGSGLGLAIAKSFVELQEGSFEVKIDGDLFKVIIRFKKI